jgi:hypothetical protein
VVGNLLSGTGRFMVLLLGMLLLSECKDENETDSLLLISPYEIYLPAEPFDIITLDITCTSGSSLKNLTITSKLEESYTEVILDSSISGKNFKMIFEYRVPEVHEATNIFLGIKLTDINDHLTQSGKILEVTVNERYLSETTGHEMYSMTSGKMNAYNLYTLQPLFSEFSLPEEMHIMDSSDSPYISRKLTSPAGIEFVRYRDFDYANCTNISLKAAYNASIKHEYVENLEDGEVLLMKLFGNNADSSYLALKIVNIIDTRGSEFDRYIFNVKR